MNVKLSTIVVTLVMTLSSVGLIYFLSRSRRASRVMSLIIMNVLLAVTCIHFVWPSLPMNGFTLAVVTLLGLPGTAGLALIQNYLL
jgi:uncharacterized membrane protein